MPRNKDLKRLVRARMRKTGEAYTAARAQLVLRSEPNKATAAATAAPAPARAPGDYAAIAGMRDEVLKEKTGCTWERWVLALDRAGAAGMTHREIARLVSTRYKVPSWWSQTVTVGYERIKGMRARGQRRDGTWEVTKSRTFHVPVADLYEAWADGRQRRRWLDGARVTVRTATAPKSVRFEWDRGGIIAVNFTPRGDSRSSVAVQHSRLPDRETALALKQYWSERLDALAQQLAG